MLQLARMSALLAEIMATIDPRSHDFGELSALVLITKVAAVFEDGQRALGQSRMKPLGVICRQEGILFAPEYVDRKIERREIWVDVFAPFGIALEPLCDRPNPTCI